MIKKVILICLLLQILTCFNFAYSENQSELIFDGQIGKKLEIRVTLSIINSEVSGIYCYKKYGKDIKLSGNMTCSKIIMNEYDDSGNITGIFSGYFTESQNKIDGIWSKPDGSLKLPFTLEHVKQIINPYLDCLQISEEDLDYIKSDTKDKISRIRADFNNDGFEDIAISCSMFWGVSGRGPWKIYMSDGQGGYFLFTELFIHGLQLIVAKNNQVNIGKIYIMYDYYNSKFERDITKGLLTEYLVTKRGMEEISGQVYDFNDNSPTPLNKKFALISKNDISVREVILVADYFKNKNPKWINGYYSL